MSGGRLAHLPSSYYNSTPVKSSQKQALPTSNHSDNDVLSDDEERFSFLSPIYSDSSNSDGDLEPSDSEKSEKSSTVRSSKPSLSPDRCELPRRSPGQIFSGNDEPACSPALSAWELWLVRKAKEDRLNLQKKAKEESMLKEREEEKKMLQERKKFVVEEKIQEWLKVKREQEIQNQLARQSKEEEEIKKMRQKERENEQKAQQKYKNWLKKKNQEKMELEKREKEKAVLKEEQERERRKRADEKFKEWLAKANERGRDSPRTPRSPTNPFDRSRASPSYFNPIPWKPVHIPPPEKPKEGACGRRPQRRQRCNQSLSAGVRPRTAPAPGQLQRR